MMAEKEREQRSKEKGKEEKDRWSYEGVEEEEDCETRAQREGGGREEGQGIGHGSLKGENWEV